MDGYRRSLITNNNRLQECERGARVLCCGVWSAVSTGNQQVSSLELAQVHWEAMDAREALVVQEWWFNYATSHGIW